MLAIMPGKRVTQIAEWTLASRKRKEKKGRRIEDAHLSNYALFGIFLSILNA